MASEAVPKTAILTLFGMFKFLCLPFGLWNAGNAFQRMLDQILGNLPYCFVHIDGILVFSPDLTSHIQHLRDVLELCRAHCLKIGLGKCEFAVPEIEFLGHHFASSGLHPLPKHTSAFHQVELLLASVPVLTHPEPGAPISLAVLSPADYTSCTP